PQFFILIGLDFPGAPFFRFNQFTQTAIELAAKANTSLSFTVVPAGGILQRNWQSRIDAFGERIGHELYRLRRWLDRRVWQSVLLDVAAPSEVWLEVKRVGG